MGRFDGEPLRVLYVGTDAERADATASRIEGEGPTVEAVAGRAAALDRLAGGDHGFDCVVSAHGEDPDALALHDAVGEDHPRLPFVVFTDAGDEALATEAMAAGVDGYVPRDEEAFGSLVDQVVAAVERERDRHAAEDSRFRDLIEHTTDLILVVDESGAVQYQSPSVERVLGYDAEELVGDVVIDYIHPEDRETVTGSLAELRDREGWTTERVEHRLRDADGEWRWFQLVGTNRRDAADSYVVTARDITEHKARERRLTSLHEAAYDLAAAEGESEVFDMLMDAAEDIIDIDLAVADAVEDDVLVPVAMSSQMTDEGYYEETPVDAEDNIAARSFRTGETVLVEDIREAESVPADSTFRSGVTVPIGEFGVFQSVSREVGAYDERDVDLVELLVEHTRSTLARLERERELHERREALERENERLDEFASVVSHDLRNPMNVAQGRLDLARERHDDEDLETVADALGRMETLIDGLLTLARRGQVVEETDPIDLAGVCRRCWGNVRTEDATIDVAFDGTILADRPRLTQLLENLFRNAVEHGGSDVHITVGALDGNGFYVADDGPGIPAEKRERVFESGYSTGEEGTGFGLRIVRDIAEAHGWSVEATESDEGGARFEIRGVDRP
jgi:PAS domain S-box-containing protein